MDVDVLRLQNQTKMLNKFRRNIESRRYTTLPFWSRIIKIKDFFASTFRGKKETESARVKKEKAFYKQFISKNSLVFDIGANHGQKAKTFLFIGAKVIAVEPQIECVQDLKKNLGSHKNLTIIEKGVGEKEEVKTMFISAGSDMASTFSEDWKNSRFESMVNWDQKRAIELTTLENLISHYGIPDFCKIDVEGFETEVLKGLKSKIKVIGFEFAEESLLSCFEALEILENIGFNEFNISKEEKFVLEFSKWMSKEEFLKFLEEECDVNRKEFWGDIYCR
jgi:FkbM family methyltransferase